ncbi:SDR family oxidoreductase [Sorangium sp. So ce1128]
MTALTERTLLVTGASGRLGRRAVELLLESGAGRVIAATRTPDRAGDLAARGAEVRRANFDEPDALAAAFAGVDRVLMVSTDAVTEPGRRLRQQRNAVDAAAQAGVKHVVYTSFTRPEPGSPISYAADHYGTEQALAASGLGFTALRYNFYAEAVLRRVPAMLKEGKLVVMAGAGGVAYIAREDCARVAAVVMASAEPPRGAVEISGPEAITGEELARLTSEITGTAVRCVALSEEALLEELVASGTPRSRAASRVSSEAAAAGGYLGFTTNAVEELTGRPPVRLRDFLTTALSDAPRQ